MRDYYEILEADRNTSDSELKKKYRKLASKYLRNENNHEESENLLKKNTIQNMPINPL
mgnify:CR=1 FL=1